MKKLFTFLAIILACGVDAQVIYCYEDADGDGYGNPNRYAISTEFGCPFGYTANNGLDCNDDPAAGGATINPNTIWYKDLDNDGYTDGLTKTQCTRPQGYKLLSEIINGLTALDCNDLDRFELPKQQWYSDPDRDRYTSESHYSFEQCLSPGPGYVSYSELKENGTVVSENCPGLQCSEHFIFDCNPNNPIEHPFQTWHKDADGDKYPGDLTDSVACSCPVGYSAESELSSLTDIDCDDTDANINQGNIWYEDADHDGYYVGSPLNQCYPPSAAYTKTVLGGGDCNDNDPVVHPNQHWVHDNDHDRYAPLEFSITQCTRPQGYFAVTEMYVGIDCNDNNIDIHPGATEICDNVDNNCDGQIDEGMTTYEFVLDADGDGYYPGSPIVQCTSPGGGYILLTHVVSIGGVFSNKYPGDCNDDNGAINPDSKWVVDADGDGFYPGSPIVQCMSPGAGYILLTQIPIVPVGLVPNKSPGDCNDDVVGIHPGATEVCDGVDNDCDGFVDEGVNLTFYRDMDGDGYGNATVSVQACSIPAGYVANNTDCNDNVTGIHPNATEVCDGVDNDCDGLIDEGVKLTFYRDMDGDGYGNASVTAQACSAPAGYVSNSSDCNDSAPAIHPGATEVCDGADNDCDGLIDEGVKLTFYRDVDGDGYGNAAISTLACSAPAGYVSNNTDCNDTAPGTHPNATEVCDGTDNDCDGLIDEGVKLTFYRDVDGDGYGNAAISILACSAPAGYAANNTDCNDTDPTVNPGAVEVCGNNKDDNCNGVQNEAACYTCGNATSFSTTNVTSNSATLNWVSIPHPNNWQLQYKSTSPGTKWIDVTPDPAGNRRSVTINGLTPNKNYQWHIKAKCGNGWTTYSISILFTTAGGVTARSEATTNAEMEASDVAIGSFQVKANPNPSNTSFRITLNSNNLKEPVKLFITDMLGRVIETRTTNAGQIIIGEKYRSGTYLVRIIQGKETRQLKLIKLSD